MFSLFIEGFCIGFAIAMPIGPISLLCMRNTFLLGIMGGVVSALGAGLADAIIGGLSGLCLTQINAFVNAHPITIHTLGAIVLCWIGTNIFRTAKDISRTKEQTFRRPARNLAFTCVSTMAFTAINPITLLSYLAVFSAITTHGPQITNFTSFFSITHGIFWGSFLWLVILAAITMYLKKTIDTKYLVKINQISGICLILLGLGSWLKTILYT